MFVFFLFIFVFNKNSQAAASPQQHCTPSNLKKIGYFCFVTFLMMLIYYVAILYWILDGYLLLFRINPFTGLCMNLVRNTVSYILCVFMPATVLQMFPSLAALWSSSWRLQLEKLFQGCYQGYEGSSMDRPPPNQRFLIHGCIPGSAGCHLAPAWPVVWTYHWSHQTPVVRQPTCGCGITSGPVWRLMVGYFCETSSSLFCKSLILREVVLRKLGEQQSASAGRFMQPENHRCLGWIWW